jgi:hypothetical protein
MGRLPSPAGAICRGLDRARRRTEVPVVFCIDVEPDARVFDRGAPRPWLGFERFLQRLPALRRRLSEVSRAPAAFTWFLRMDPQVAETWGSPAWAAETYGDVFAELAGSGDELGLHTHNWRWDLEAREWVADYDDPAWGEHCLRTGLDAFETCFGRACAVHRGGDHFLSGAMLSCLAARGVTVDLTVEPGQFPSGALGGERTHGLSPDYRAVPTEPYRSTPGTFPAPEPAGRTGPVLVPLLSAPGRRGRRSPLSPETSSVRFVPRLAAELLRKPPPLLAVVVRTHVALGPRWDSLADNLEHLARHRHMRFVTASAAVEGLGDHSAPRRAPAAVHAGGW